MHRVMHLGFVACVALAACGDNNGPNCGEGTRLVGIECVPETPLTCGSGTIEMDGMCIGTDSDTTPPGPVTGLTATEASGIVTLAWTNPTDADFDSVLIVRRPSIAVVGAPSRGVMYMPGTPLSDGSKVVALTTSATAMDPDAAKGLAFYAVFARDKAGNWSAPARVHALLPAGVQNANISVALAGTLMATVTQQPPNFHLDVLAFDPDVDSTSLDVQVRITNLLERPVFNLKLVVLSTNQGTITGDGTIGANQYFDYGRAGLLPGASRTEMIRISNGLGGADPVLLSVRIDDNPLLLANEQVYTPNALRLVDTATYVVEDLTCADALVPVTDRGGCSVMNGVLSDDARRLTVAYRNLPALVVFETSSFRAVGGVNLASGLGIVGQIAADKARGVIYAVLTTGQHGTYGSMSNVGGRRAGQIDFVRLDAETLAETGRLMLRTVPTPTGSGSMPQAKDLAVSPDGKYAAIPISGAQEVYIIDLATFTIVDTNAAMAGVQPLDLSAATTAATRSVAFTADSTKLAIGYSGSDGEFTDNDGTITLANTTTWALTPVAPVAAVADGGYVARIERAPDGSMWVLRNYDSGLSVFTSDFTSETQIDTRDTGPGSPQQIAFSRGKAYIGTGENEIAVFDIATRTREDLDSTTAGVNNTPMNRGGHFALITPF